jgi:hypothetical protein
MTPHEYPVVYAKGAALQEIGDRDSGNAVDSRICFCPLIPSRDNVEFWRLWRLKRPETISPSNSFLVDEIIKAKVSGKLKFKPGPKVDKIWIKHFPEHRGNLFKNQPLFHHHVDHGPYTIPVPKASHQNSRGPWHL